MVELAGPLIENPIPRHKKVRFVCQGCGMIAEDFAIGYVVSSGIDIPNKKRKYLVRGQFAASCAFRFIEETRYTYSEHLQELFTGMFLELYGVPPSVLKERKKSLPPARWQIPQYVQENQKENRDQRVTSGIEFHKRYELPLHKPKDPEMIGEHRSTFLLVAESLQNLNVPLSELKKWFPTLYFKSNSAPTELVPNTNIKRFSLFSAMNAQQEQQLKEQQDQNEKKNVRVLDKYLIPLPKSS